MDRKLEYPRYLRLRWLAFAGQCAVLAVAAAGFDLTLPWKAILSLLLLIPASDVVVRFTRLGSISGTSLTGVLLSFDIFLLTAVLSQAGGPTNPFTIFYLVHVVLAAVLLTPTWTWTAAVLSSLGFAALFLFSVPVPEWQDHGAHHGFSLHLHGMFIAFLMAASLVAHFLGRIVREVQRSALRLQQLETVAANQQRLALLTTITAGAAHELGTPLATIAVVSRELERALMLRGEHGDLLEDITLLKEETVRCKEIIQDLSARTGDLTGESPETVRVGEVVREAVGSLGGGAQLELSGSLDSELRVPRKAVASAVRALVKNAGEAAVAGSGPVRIHSGRSGGKISIRITDSGCGMDPETLSRIGDPFFSTKAPGKGMGLGVYLARLTVEQLGGELSFQSRPQGGTTATISLPIDCISKRAA